jgi:hypothetical protein
MQDTVIFFWYLCLDLGISDLTGGWELIPLLLPFEKDNL